MVVRALLIFLGLIFSPLAFPGGEYIGNGGDVLECKENGRVTSIELLDFYEARFMGRPYTIDLGEESLSVIEKVEIFLERIDRVDPERGERYRNFWSVFFDEAQIEPMDLIDIPDSGHIGVPYGCGIKQAAIHREPIRRTDKRYFIDQSFWDLLDNTNKAGLIIHEIVYREAYNLGHRNSLTVRDFVSWVTSREFSFVTSFVFQEYIYKNDLTFQSLHQGIDIRDLHITRRHPNGMPEEAEVLPGRDVFFYYKGKKLEIDADRNYDIGFHDNGHVSYAQLKFGESITVVYSGQSLKVDGFVIFYKDGNLLNGDLVDPLEVSLQGQSVTLKQDISFGPNMAYIIGADVLEAPDNMNFRVVHQPEAMALETSSLRFNEYEDVIRGNLLAPTNMYFGGHTIRGVDYFNAAWDWGKTFYFSTKEDSTIGVNGQLINFQSGRLEFHTETATLKEGTVESGTILNIRGKQVIIERVPEYDIYGLVHFHKNGIPAGFQLSRDTELYVRGDNGAHFFRRLSRVGIDSNGFVVHGQLVSPTNLNYGDITVNAVSEFNVNSGSFETEVDGVYQLETGVSVKTKKGDLQFSEGKLLSFDAHEAVPMEFQGQEIQVMQARRFTFDQFLRFKSSENLVLLASDGFYYRYPAGVTVRIYSGELVEPGSTEWRVPRGG